MKKVLKIASISSFLLFVLTITGTLETLQTPISEVRKGSTVEYSVNNSEHQNGDEYSWEIVGGTPSVTPTSGSGTAADPYVINFTVNLHTINIQWNADDNTITAFNGRVRVQKRSGGCISAIQTQQVDAWSAATAAITSPLTGEICNGENVGYVVTVTFTGAPVFDFDYRIDNSLSGTLVQTDQTISGITGNTVDITIPDHLLNATNADQTYSIVITRMNDNFVGNGTVGAANTYTITVHPAASTGTISVSPSSLQRR